MWFNGGISVMLFTRKNGKKGQKSVADSSQEKGKASLFFVT